jgi:hypothetical protein
MAQAGFTPISLYFSSTAAAVPTSGNLVDGEIALNTADMKLYAKNSAGTVTLLASSSGAAGTVSSVSGTGTVNGLTLTGTVTTSGSLTLGGTLSLVSPPPIGSTTPNTGAFTTLSASGNLTSLTAQFGTSPAGVSIGVIGIPNQKRIYGRNAANSADLSILFIDGNNSLVLGSADSTAIDSSGNMGIGTTSPAAKLHVVGTVRSANGAGTVFSSLATDGVYATGTDLYLLAPTGYSTIIYANNSEKFRVGTQGQLGIGGANYGTAGQVLTSGGASAAPTWSTAGGGTTMLFCAFSSTGGF